MNIQAFTILLNGQETTVRMGEVTVPTLQIMGGIAGPPGLDGGDGSALVQAHINDPTPHPAYDDLPSMTLLFENGLV